MFVCIGLCICVFLYVCPSVCLYVCLSGPSICLAPSLTLLCLLASALEEQQLRLLRANLRTALGPYRSYYRIDRQPTEDQFQPDRRASPARCCPDELTATFTPPLGQLLPV